MIPTPDFHEENKVVALSGEVALVDGKFPASAAFLDVSDFQRVVFLVFLGALDSIITFAVQQAAAINGTPKAVTDATVVIAATDDAKWLSIEVEVRKLDINNGYHYVTLDVSGATGNDYAAIFAFLRGPGYQPVTQPAGYYSHVVVAG
jgi:hypothetical protein